MPKVRRFTICIDCSEEFETLVQRLVDQLYEAVQELPSDPNGNWDVAIDEVKD